MADWIWTLDDDPSGLSVPGSNFDKRLLRFAENAGEIIVDVAFDSTETDYFFSEPGQPSSNAWRAGEVWRIGIDVTQANVKISLRVAIARINSAGVFQAWYTTLSGSVLLNTTGTRVFSGTTLAQTNPQAGDRLRVWFQWTRDNSFGGDGIVKIGFGDPANDFVEVPIEMANSLITWDGNALNFPNPLTGYEDGPRSRRSLRMSDGKVHAIQLSTKFHQVRIEMARFDDADFEADLEAWWAWALQGNQYAFARDSADQVDTTLDGAAAAAQKVVPLTSTAGIVVGKLYKILEAAGNNWEVINVASIIAGVSVTAVNNLKYAYVSGDVFRTRHFFPKVIATESDKPWVENRGLTYTLAHTMREDAG